MAWTVYIQWSEDPMRDFIAYDVADWASIPAGSVNRAFVQGIGVGDDHLWMEEMPDGKLDVRVWSDNGYAPGERPWGVRWILSHEVGEWTFPSGNGIMTRRGPHQHVTFYVPPGEEKNHVDTDCCGEKVGVEEFKEFPFPPENEQRHGVMVSDSLWATSQVFHPPEWTP